MKDSIDKAYEAVFQEVKRLIIPLSSRLSDPAAVEHMIKSIHADIDRYFNNPYAHVFMHHYMSMMVRYLELLHEVTFLRDRYNKGCSREIDCSNAIKNLRKKLKTSDKEITNQECLENEMNNLLRNKGK